MTSKMSGSGGAIPKTKYDSAKNSKSMSTTGTTSKAEKVDEFVPLEIKVVECKSETAVITKVPALSKRWAPAATTKWIEFYLPELQDFQNKDDHVVSVWAQYMELLMDDLKWLLKLPHHQFWSCMVYCPAISQEVLASFVKSAPRFYDANYSSYERHPAVWPIYKDIYVLVFRIYMRLATYKESKEDHITQSFWSNLLHDHKLINISTLMSLSTIYESKENPVFQKITENVIKYDPRFIQEMRSGIPILVDKFRELSNEIQNLLAENCISNVWNPMKFEQILWFKLDSIYSLYKFLKAYPQAAKILLHYPNFVSSMAASYETNARVWGKLIGHMPNLEDRVALCRAAVLRLFRIVLATSTILVVESANDKRLDEFFEYFANCIDEKVFIHDYEKSFPFKSDMESLLSRGIFVDETRIDYMANAISACFHSCGEEYSVEKIVVDPLYDPNFDRQLLGACSLEVTGIELESLITQVKDLLPDLPNSYIEAVLKHYGYSTETTINALLEGSVPLRLEKYKSEDYIKSRSNPCLAGEPEEPHQDKIPVPFPGEDRMTVSAESKTSSTFQYKEFTDLSTAEKADIKSKILESCEPVNFMEQSVKSFSSKSKARYEYESENKSAYVDESLLPTFNESVDYEDEYDDTYDDVSAGMAEPDNNLFNPLNKRKIEMEDQNSPEDDQDERAPEKNVNFDAFCEDPAIVRERFERRRQEMHSRRGGGGGNHSHKQPQPAQNRDVVGRAKGQGQENSVIYNRRQKTENKGAGGSYKKRSDFKRKEF